MPAIRRDLVIFAREMARDSTCEKKHAALVVKGSRVLGAATNKQKTHIREIRLGRIKDKKWDRPRVVGLDIVPKSYHAEKTALLRANGNTRGAVLYSFRDGPFKRSRPCKECLHMARERGIRFIVYDTGPIYPDDVVEGKDMSSVDMERI